jgi:hypothetical protein
METFIEWRRAALAGLRASPARVMDRRVHAYVRRRSYRPESLDEIADALFTIIQMLPAGAAPSCRRYLRVLAGRALRQVLPRETTTPGLSSGQELNPYLARALTQLPRVHAAVLIGRKWGLDDEALARAANVPQALVDRYYAQAYAMIRCNSWNG